MRPWLGVVCINIALAFIRDSKMRKSVYTLMISFVMYIVVGSVSIAQAETIFVKYRGMVDLREFSCTNIESSFVHRICYKKADKYLVVLLTDTYYHYCQIPQDVVQHWLSVDSKGKFYNAKIKGNFDCRLNGYTVTPSVSGVGGAIDPSEPVLAYSGDRISFTIMSNSGYSIDSVRGTCGGKLVENIFTTDEISGNCTVIVKFQR